MPKCLFRYQWVKLPRTHLPVGKGIMGYWAKLASRAAFRKGRAKYCGYTNDVMPGMLPHILQMLHDFLYLPPYQGASV